MTDLSLVRHEIAFGFPGLRHSDIEDVARYFSRIDLRPGEAVFREGDVGDYLCVIAQGQILVSGDGTEIARLAPGHVFGEMSLLDSWTRSATCTAIGRCVLFTLDSESMRRIVREHPGAASRMLLAIAAALARRLRKAGGNVATSLWKEQEPDIGG